MPTETDLPPMDDGDRVWFAMIADGEVLDCYVDREVLRTLRRGPSDDLLHKFAIYRPVFELMIRDLHHKGWESVVSIENVSRL